MDFGEDHVGRGTTFSILQLLDFLCNPSDLGRDSAATIMPVCYTMD
jgi:hypothetical protein